MPLFPFFDAQIEPLPKPHIKVRTSVEKATLMQPAPEASEHGTRWRGKREGQICDCLGVIGTQKQTIEPRPLSAATRAVSREPSAIGCGTRLTPLLGFEGHSLKVR